MKIREQIQMRTTQFVLVAETKNGGRRVLSEHRLLKAALVNRSTYRRKGFECDVVPVPAGGNEALPSAWRPLLSEVRCDDCGAFFERGEVTEHKGELVCGRCAERRGK